MWILFAVGDLDNDWVDTGLYSPLVTPIMVVTPLAGSHHGYQHHHGYHDYHGQNGYHDHHDFNSNHHHVMNNHCSPSNKKLILKAKGGERQAKGVESFPLSHVVSIKRCGRHSARRWSL